MNRILGRVLTVVACGALAGALAPACATNDMSIYIRGALAPSANRQNGCVYTDDPAQPTMFEGSFDLGVRDSYTAVLMVGNQMIQRGDPAAVRAESNRVHLDGAIVRVTNPDGSLIREFTSTGAGFADPQNNNQPDFGPIGVTVIDADTKAALEPLLPNRAATKLVLANIKVFGRSLGGIDMESGEFQFPIRVCKGCLVTFAGANDPAAPVQPNCLKPLEGGRDELPCFSGQDELTPCQVCQGRPACDPAVP